MAQVMDAEPDRDSAGPPDLATEVGQAEGSAVSPMAGWQHSSSRAGGTGWSASRTSWSWRPPDGRPGDRITATIDTLVDTNVWHPVVLADLVLRSVESGMCDLAWNASVGT